MAERDGAAVEVDLAPSKPSSRAHGDRLAGEGLVQLDDVEVLDA